MFVIAFLDEGSFTDSRWFPSQELFRKDYRFYIGKKLIEHEWAWGLVIKPKKPSTLVDSLGEEAALLEAASSTGRLHCFTEDLWISPGQAALATDLAIHNTLWAGTAGMEAALCGTPTLMLDRDGWNNSILYDLREGKVIFDSWESLWLVLQEHWSRPVQGLGDWSEVLDRLDSVSRW